MNRRAILTILATNAATSVLFVGAYVWTQHRQQEDLRERQWYAAWKYYHAHPEERSEYFHTQPGAEREYVRMEEENLRWEREHPDAGSL